MAIKDSVIKRRDPEPTITRLELLVESIKEGRIKLPNFQRPYVWQRNDIINLLDSIYRGYPIGSILLWATTEKLSSERSILESLDLDVEENSFHSEYLLDGQQRLTSVCGVLYWDGQKKTNKWNVYFNLESEEFLHADAPDSIVLFPLNKLLETRSFLKECLKFEHHPKASVFYRRAENLLKAVKDYKIAVVKIGDMKLEEVAPVFERINSRGRVLTMLDLMRAATWKGGFDLNEKISNIVLEIEKMGFGDLDPELVLKCISVSAGKGFNKADIDKLRHLNPDELFKAADLADQNIKHALIFLESTSRVSDVSLIPYFQQVLLLSEFFRVNGVEYSSEQRNELCRWFWLTSVSKYFSGASTGDNSRELNLMRNYASQKINTIFEEELVNFKDLIWENFNLRSASSSTVAALLNSKVGDQDLKGSIISQKEIKKSKDFFKSVLVGTSFENLNISQVLCKGKASLSFDEISNWPEHVLEKNFLNRRLITLINQGRLDSFVQERSVLFAKHIMILSGSEFNWTN